MTRKTSHGRLPLAGLGPTVPKAAQALKLSEPTLRRAIARGEVECVTFGGLSRIPNDEIARLRKLLRVDQREAANQQGQDADAIADLSQK